MSRYQLIRFYAGDHEAEELGTVPTLADAQRMCNNPETSSQTCTTPEGMARTAQHGDWFVGYRKMYP